MKKWTILFISMLCCIVSYGQNITGTWHGMLSVGVQKMALVMHLTNDANGNATCKLDSPDQGAFGIEAKIVYISADSVNFTVPVIGASYAGRLNNGVIKGTFSQGGMPLPLSLEKGDIVRKRPQTPQPEYPYTTEEVTFENKQANATLSGTLTYPVNYTKKSNVPVVLFVSGSGQQNRDEELFEHKPFLVISDYLAKNGIASLRYDDRGYGKSHGGELENATTADFTDDAKAGIEFLKARKAFSRIGVIGHSEGGQIAIMLASKGVPNFIVCLAAPGVSGDTILAEQQNTLLMVNGIKSRRVTRQDVRANLTSSKWMEYFINYDVTKDLPSVNCPIMALNGSKDMQVSPKLNLESIKRFVKPNELNKFVCYDGLNHLFQHCETGLPTEYPNIEETISPEVLKDIVDWIHVVTKTKK